VCQLDKLRKCLKVETLRKALKSLPKTLDDTYARILLSIDEDYMQDALKVLQWLSFSSRPLRIEEVAEVVAVDQGSDPQFDSERRLSEPHDLLIICSSLVTISSTTLELANGTLEETEELRLAHFSVKEYLLSERIRAGPASKFHILEIPAHLSIAQTCLAYLLQFNKPNSLTPNTSQEYPLTRYAAKYWAKHAKARDASEAPLDLLTTKLFGLEKDCFLNWIRMYDPDLPWAEPDFSREVESIAPQLYYASLLGLNQVVQWLLERGVDINAQGGRLFSALQAASFYGHVQVVQQLLERGANINAQGGHIGNALQAASLEGHDQVVQQLLEWGADINAHGAEGSALLGASFNGNDQVVQQLLKWGADVNNQGGYFGNALQAASLKGRDQIVQWLLESGANVNAQGGFYGSALQAASRWGHDQIVQRLLESGASVNTQGGQYGNALWAASVNGHNQVIQRLLEWGADNNTWGEESNARQDASLDGREQKGQLLTENRQVSTEYIRLAREVIQLQKELEQQRAEIVQLRAKSRDYPADTTIRSALTSELMRYASVSYTSLTDLEKLSEDELESLDKSLHCLVRHVRYSDWTTFCRTDKLDREFQESLKAVGVGWSEGLAQPYWTNGGIIPTPRDVQATAGEIRYYMDHGGTWYVPKIYPERINVMNALISLCRWRGVPLE
jgi:ankyrin repeat protein